MIKRRLRAEISKTLRRSPSVALLGARQVGKTTLAIDMAEGRAITYVDLEDRLDLEKVKDIVSFHEANRDKLIVLDEIQRLPEVFAQLRSIIDRERRKDNKTGQFLFLGSASMELLQQSSESLAGRIAYLELHPIDVVEYAQGDLRKMEKLWLRGGFPESLLASNEADSMAWRNDFVKTYLERDIPQIANKIPAETLRRFWTMLAHHQGAVFNAAQLARNLEVTGVTIARYLDMMVDLLLVRRLKPWTANVGKRLVKAPKVYVRDAGIVHSLLNIKSYNELLAHPVIGGSWEGFVIENIMAVLPAHAHAYYYRTAGGAEIDLILEMGVDERWAIEIKRSSAPSLSKGFYIGCEDVKVTEKFVIYAGQDTFKTGEGILAISLYDFMQRLITLSD